MIKTKVRSKELINTLILEFPRVPIFICGYMVVAVFQDVGFRCKDIVVGHDLSRLDDFEGSFYERRIVQVMTDNNIFAAEAYVLKDSYHHIATDKDWDPEKFEDQGINQFLGSYFGFDH